MRPIVWLSSAPPRALKDRLPRDTQVVETVEGFLAAARDARTLSFVDAAALARLDEFAMHSHDPVERRKLLAAVSMAPVVAICEEPLAGAVAWLRPRPWLSHVVAAAALDGKPARARVDDLFEMAELREPRDWLKPETGRRVRITHASRRGKRLERMTQFLQESKVDRRTVELLRETTNELLVNAFYEAPVAAGVMSKRIDRTRDVALPTDFAVDIAYGLRGDLAIVRVRDPFGALSRERLVDVLARRAQPTGRATTVPPETTEAGLWRVLGSAALVAISVAGNQHTQVLVGIPIKGAATGYGVHLFFKPGPSRGLWKLLDDDTGSPVLHSSVTISLEK